MGEQLISHAPGRMAPKHSEIVRKELDMILKAGINTPITSAWLFSVGIATNRDDESSFL